MPSWDKTGGNQSIPCAVSVFFYFKRNNFFLIFSHGGRERKARTRQNNTHTHGGVGGGAGASQQHTHTLSHDEKRTRVERAGATRHGEGHGPTDGLSAG